MSAVSTFVPENYLNHKQGILSWLLTTDHKRIGWLFIVSITVFFFIGGAVAVLMRIELVTPAGDLVSPDTYNKLFSLHGIIMVWFFLVPSIPSTLGNFLLPLMIGARDLAFPKINLMSWYVYSLGGLFVAYAVIAGGVDTGWTFYTPYSSMFSNTHVVAAALGVFIAGFSSIMTGVNFIATIHKMRAPGMTWSRLPLFVWSMYATSIIMVLATPVLGMTVLLLSMERLFGIGIFDPALGGDPVLFQHLFWFYSHPAVYIMILPGMGVVNEIIPTFARRKIFGYTFMVASTMAIALLGFLVWGHHMFTSSQSMYSSLTFGLLSFMVAVPSAIKTFNWVATLHKGSISFEAPMLYALGFVALFATGGITGLYLATLAVDVHVHDTYFVVAHFHFIMVGGMVTAYIGGLHFWWPKMTGRMYPDYWGRIAAGLIFAGFMLTFFPQYIMGYLGMPRRYYAYPSEFQIYHILSSAGAVILAAGYLLPLLYFAWSLRYGKPAPANPWRAAGLEWQTPSPPPEHNFVRTPIVTEDMFDKILDPNEELKERA